MKLLRGLAVTAAVVALTGCSSGQSNAPATTTPPTTAPSASAASASGGSATSGTAIAVTESEFAIALPAKTLVAGTYTFNVTNTGKFPHDLTVNGPGVEDQASPTLASGEAGNLTVALQKGSYEFYCAVDGHRDRGMNLTVEVT
jgi:uncharacterized cupredoxin-like copper-binding protein